MNQVIQSAKDIKYNSFLFRRLNHWQKHTNIKRK